MTDMKKIPEGVWKKKLTKEQFAVLREKATERPFTGKLLKNKEKGAYICAACKSVLFDSDVKFDSGTGWPSFYDAKKGAVKFVRDDSHGLRIEVVCAKCGGHLGHLFDDGPTEVRRADGTSVRATGQRYCINSCALDFRKKK